MSSGTDRAQQAQLAPLPLCTAADACQVPSLQAAALTPGWRQAAATRDYLHSLNQAGDTLPVGPVITSPDGLFPSLYRELVLRRPHEFKIRHALHCQLGAPCRGWCMGLEKS